MEDSGANNDNCSYLISLRFCICIIVLFCIFHILWNGQLRLLNKKRLYERPITFCNHYVFVFFPSAQKGPGEPAGTLSDQHAVVAWVSCHGSAIGRDCLTLRLLAPSDSSLTTFSSHCPLCSRHADLLFLEHTQQTTDLRHLPTLFPLPGTLFLLIIGLLAPSLPSDPCWEVSSSERPFLSTPVKQRGQMP